MDCVITHSPVYESCNCANIIWCSGLDNLVEDLCIIGVPCAVVIDLCLFVFCVLYYVLITVVTVCWFSVQLCLLAQQKKMPGKHSFQPGFIENCQYAVKLLFDCCCLHSSPYYYCQPTPHHTVFTGSMLVLTPNQWQNGMNLHIIGFQKYCWVRKMGLEALWCFGFFRLFLHAEAFTEVKAPP